MKKKIRLIQSKTVLVFIMLLSVFIVSAITLYPIAYSLVHSFFSNKIASPSVFVGLVNYQKLLSNKTFWLTFVNSLILLISIPLLIISSLIVSSLIHSYPKTAIIFKTIIVFPQVLSSIIIASVFGAMFGYNGIINFILGFFKVEQIYWLGNKLSAFFVIILCIVYSMFGWQTLIFSSAYTSIDTSILHLMQIDGANLFYRIIIYANQIKRTIMHSIILNTIYCFSGFFGIIYTLTKGGPGYQTTTVDYLVYIQSFKSGNDLSNAYTTAMVLLVFVLFLTGILYFVFERISYDRKKA